MSLRKQMPKTAFALSVCLVLTGCTTSSVVTGDDAGSELEKAPWEMTVADFAAAGDYVKAEKLARASLSGGTHPGRYEKVLMGAGVSDEVRAAAIPPSSPQDETMHLLNLASVLLLEGKKDEAHETFDRAAQKIEEQFDPDSQALKLTRGESEKFFKGDGYERATMYAFLAMSFLERGEYQDAIKMARRGIAADGDAEKGEYRADYALLPYIGYLAAAKVGRVQEARGFDEMVFSICGFRPSKEPLPDSLVVVWTGGGTSRELGGEYDEIRYIRKGSLRGALDAVAIEADGICCKSLPGLADMNYQAVTRGRRIMDNVLEDKAKVKRGFAASGNFLLAFSAACFQGAGASGNGCVAIALCAVGGLSVGLGFPTHLVGMMINAEADPRSWTVLPGRMLVVPVSGVSGAACLHGYRGWDGVLRTNLSADLSKSGNEIKVIHCSLLPMASRIHAYERQTFIEPAERIRAAVRGGWDKSEITEGTER